MEKKKLSVSDGIKIQQEHLQEWKKLLKPELYAILEQHCEQENAKLSEEKHNGYNVFRGQDFYEFAVNVLKHR